MLGTERAEQVNTSEEAQVWDQYMAKKRDWRELVSLIQREDIKPEFHHRAIQTLLAPDTRKLPFAANLDTGLGTYVSVSNHWTGQINGEQAAFIAGLLPEYIEQAEQIIKSDDYSYSAQEALSTYNNLIPVLLPKLPPKQAEKLFAHFSLVVVGDCSSPLRNLYYDRVIDESWKRQAAIKVHEIIHRKQSRKTRQRVEHEIAIRDYSNILSLMLYRDRGSDLPISREFYQDEIVFMLDVDTGRPIFEPWHTGTVLALLNDSDIRYKFVRRQVLTGDPESLSGFIVYDEARATTARQILTEFPDDQELKVYLEQQLVEWQVRSERDRLQKEEAARIEQEISLRMKVPTI